MRASKWSNARPVELDGRTLEGGGQLIRNALCLSALTGIPVTINNIRGNRSKGGGLKAQHLACVNWLAHACSARVEGAKLKSTTLTFEPGMADEASRYMDHSPAFRKVTRDGELVYECRLDIGTAGSTGLALQAILPFILFSSELASGIPVHLTLSGGTNVSGSPSYDYITQVLLPTLWRIGFPAINAKLEKRGWSQGGSSIGSFTLVIPPRDKVLLPAFRLDRPAGGDSIKRKPDHLRATFIAPQLCHRACRDAIPPAIKRHFGDTFSSDNGNLEIICEDSGHEARMYLLLVATISISHSSIDEDSTPQTYKLGTDYLYDRKIRSPARAAIAMAEDVAKASAEEVESGAAIDVHMRDQLIIFQALAQGKSEVFGGQDCDGNLVEPSLHARTAEFIAKKTLKVTFDAEGSCEGIGFDSERGDEDDKEEQIRRALDGLSIS